MSTLIRTLRFVGDLDDDFYRDERQRDVWNEASAVGLQVMLWTSLAAAATLSWFAGRTGAWVALGLLAVWLIGSSATTAYARAHQVDPGVSVSWLRPRIMLSLGLYLIGFAGVAAELLVPDAAAWLGGVVGATCGMGAAFTVIHRRKQEHRRLESAAEDL